MQRYLFTFIFLLLPFAVSAHHTWSVQYKPEIATEIEGTITSIAWVNPHVRFKVLVDEGKETEQIWDIDGTSVSNLARMNVNRDILAVGDKVKMAGHGARKSDHGMYMINLLLPDGREAVFSSSAELRWTGDRVGSNETLRNGVLDTDESKRPTSIFAVWTTLLGVRESRGLFPRNTDDFPLSEAGLQRVKDYNPETDDPFGDCSAKGGASVMDAPYPIEFIDNGDTISLRLEEYDSVRTIHLLEKHDDSQVQASLLGYSTGRWDNDTLVVTTTKIDYPFIHVGSLPSFIPQSSAVSTLETFKLSAERDKLLYSLHINDPEMLTEPLQLNKFYQWREGEQLQAYSCDEV